MPPRPPPCGGCAPGARGWRIGIARKNAAAVGVERGAVVEEAVTGIQLVADDCFCLEDAVLVLVEQHARRAAAARRALGDDGAAEAVERDHDQRLGLVVRGGAIDLEAREQRERRPFGKRLILGSLAAPPASPLSARRPFFQGGLQPVVGRQTDDHGHQSHHEVAKSCRHPILRQYRDPRNTKGLWKRALPQALSSLARRRRIHQNVNRAPN